jgi:hypothetical protein
MMNALAGGGARVIFTPAHSFANGSQNCCRYNAPHACRPTQLLYTSARARLSRAFCSRCSASLAPITATSGTGAASTELAAAAPASDGCEEEAGVGADVGAEAATLVKVDEAVAEVEAEAGRESEDGCVLLSSAGGRGAEAEEAGAEEEEEEEAALDSDRCAMTALCMRWEGEPKADGPTLPSAAVAGVAVLLSALDSEAEEAEGAEAEAEPASMTAPAPAVATEAGAGEAEDTSVMK